jgi:arylsulfatase
MRANKLLISLLGGCAVFTASLASAQQITGEVGSPDATTTISGKQLPPPPPKFGGVIKDNALQSTQWWPPRGAAKGGTEHPADHD